MNDVNIVVQHFCKQQWLLKCYGCYYAISWLIIDFECSLSYTHTLVVIESGSKGQQCLPAHLSGFLSSLAQTLRCLRVYCLRWRHS